MTRRIFSTRYPIILASSSPRRQEFLNNLGINYTVITTSIDETPQSNESPEAFARRMARAKAIAVAERNKTSWVIGADTVVALNDGTILGKPENQEDAFTMLTVLNNASHQVMTAVCLCCREKQVEIIEMETTRVTFMDNPPSLLRAYVKTGEPLDKAGSYGIQGLGSFLIESINGSCSNVIGLPINRLISLLLRNKVITIGP